MIDLEKRESINSLSLYLTVQEAEKFIRELQLLLKNPAAYEHFHLFDEKNAEKELSCSLITIEKLQNLAKYNEIEKKVFLEKMGDSSTQKKKE